MSPPIYLWASDKNQLEFWSVLKNSSYPKTEAKHTSVLYFVLQHVKCFLIM